MSHPNKPSDNTPIHAEVNSAYCVPSAPESAEVQDLKTALDTQKSNETADASAITRVRTDLLLGENSGAPEGMNPEDAVNSSSKTNTLTKSGKPRAETLCSFPAFDVDSALIAIKGIAGVVKTLATVAAATVAVGALWRQFAENVLRIEFRLRVVYKRKSDGMEIEAEIPRDSKEPLRVLLMAAASAQGWTVVGPEAQGRPKNDKGWFSKTASIVVLVDDIQSGRGPGSKSVFQITESASAAIPASNPATVSPATVPAPAAPATVSVEVKAPAETVPPVAKRMPTVPDRQAGYPGKKNGGHKSKKR